MLWCLFDVMEEFVLLFVRLLSSQRGLYFWNSLMTLILKQAKVKLHSASNLRLQITVSYWLWNILSLSLLLNLFLMFLCIILSLYSSSVCSLAYGSHTILNLFTFNADYAYSS